MWWSFVRSPLTAFVHDLIMIAAAWGCAFWLRFNLGSIPDESVLIALRTLPLLLVIHGAAFFMLGLYRGVWRFASVPDLLRIGQAVILGVLVSTAVLFMATRMEGIPRSVFPLFAILLIGFLGVPRLIYRLAKDHNFRPQTGEQVLIVGAGRAGEMLVRDLFRHVNRRYLPVAFVDDDRAKLGKEIHGVRVVGTSNNIVDVVNRFSIDVILIALPSADAAGVRRIIEECERSGVPFRITPRLDDLLSGKTSVSELREVSIEDLLGRAQVTLDWGAISQGLKDKSVLVTGGGGSIGSELCRQISHLGPSSLIVADRSEFNLYSIEMELRARFPALPLHVRLVDVTDTSAVEKLFSDHKPNVVFHAAAYKHVPMLQSQVREAVFNNVIGTQRVALAADRHAVESFVLISTDKAVNPTNVMGTTKRIGEIFSQNFNRHSRTDFITVRFGNVLGSAGSVVPLFKKQIAEGGPVTVTHRDVTRYFMTIPEASQLIMQAAVNGRGGEIFVLDMGEPIKISYLAEQMIRLSGKKPGDDVEISYVGLRPGEKLYEELVHDQEPLAPTPHERILLARFREVDWNYLDKRMRDMEMACDRFDEATLCDILADLVPESSPSSALQPTTADVIPLHASSRTRNAF
ncbi:MAG: polysaccharide biosynthesis protein [Gammaproteobacteria bacterium]|nr:polysaccharide biosynthesis protein [Gammaproteobacteria bacterium]MCB1738049.1 polysaccharide biosynthesis protein [Gammaproteobacteria bacterium]MCP5137029.1 polysaccharide biosynthesis protein [Gammaproteobacteria bacterium]